MAIDDAQVGGELDQCPGVRAIFVATGKTLHHQQVFGPERIDLQLRALVHGAQSTGVVDREHAGEGLEVAVEPVRLDIELPGHPLGQHVELAHAQTTSRRERVDVLRGDRVLIGEHHRGAAAHHEAGRLRQE